MRWKLKDLLAESFNPVPERTYCWVSSFANHSFWWTWKEWKKVQKRGNSSINKTPKQNSEIKSETVKTWIINEAHATRASVTTGKHVWPQVLCPASRITMRHVIFSFLINWACQSAQICLTLSGHWGKARICFCKKSRICFCKFVPKNVSMFPISSGISLTDIPQHKLKESTLTFNFHSIIW